MPTIQDAPIGSRPDPDGDPRERILTAAVKIFLEQGFELATVREITMLANVNVSAVNYYFGSKDELVGAALSRLMEPYTRARLAALSACERAAAPSGPPLPEVVESFVRPMVVLSRDETGARPLIRLIQQVRARPSEETKRFFSQQMDPAVAAFIRALTTALPHLSLADVYWRYNFAIGSVMQVLIDSDPATPRLRQLSHGLCDTEDDEAIIAQLVAFASAAFLAPPVLARRQDE